MIIVTDDPNPGGEIIECLEDGIMPQPGSIAFAFLNEDVADIHYILQPEGVEVSIRQTMDKTHPLWRGILGRLN